MKKVIPPVGGSGTAPPKTPKPKRDHGPRLDISIDYTHHGQIAEAINMLIMLNPPAGAVKVAEELAEDILRVEESERTPLQLVFLEACIRLIKNG